MSVQQSAQQRLSRAATQINRIQRLSSGGSMESQERFRPRPNADMNVNSAAAPQSHQQQLQQQLNNVVQGGSADQSAANDELTSAVEQIRLRHQTDLKLEEERTKHQQQASAEMMKDIKDADNTTEFLLLSLQRSFNMKPQQIQQLLTNQNIVLMRASEQGLPIGDFSKISHWYSYLSQDSSFQKMIHLFRNAYQTQQEVDALLLLGALKSGLYSSDESTAQLCIQLLQKTIESLKGSGGDHRALQGFVNWFVKITKQSEDSILHNSVVQSAAECIEQHQSLVPDVSNLIFTVLTATGGVTLAQLPAILRSSYEDDVFMEYETINSILGDLNRLDPQKTKEMIESSNILQEALIEATDNHEDIALKLKTTNLLIEIWYLFPTIVSQPSTTHAGIGSLSRKDSFHFVLQQGLQERDKVFRVNLYANSFTLLDRLAQKENSETTPVYKTLIGGLVEHYKSKEQNETQLDQDTIELILRGFKTVFQEHEDVPKNLLLEPLLDQMIQNLRLSRAASEGLGGSLKTIEIEFLTSVVQDHIKMLPEDTVHLLLEYLHLVIPTSPFVANQMNLAELLGELVKEHKESIAISRLVEQQIVPQTLSQFIQTKKDEIVQATRSPLNGINAKKGRSPAKGSKGRKLLERKEQEMAAERRLKRFNIVTILDKLYDAFDGVRQQDNLVEQVRSTNKRYKDSFDQKSAGLQHLFKKWDVIIDDFRDNQSSLVPALYDGNNPNNMVVALTESNAEAESKRAERRRQKALDWNKVKEPSDPLARRAVEEFQAMKQKRIEQQNQARLEEAKRIQKQQRLNSQAKLAVAKRGLLLERDGLLRQQKLKAIFGQKDSTTALDQRMSQASLEELEPKSVLVQQLGPTRAKSLAKLNKPSALSMDGSGRGVQSSSVLHSSRRRGYKLIDLNSAEEDRERDSVRFALQKYTPLFRYLFDNYSNKQDSIKKKPPKGIAVNEKVILMKELMKMYREHNMDHGMLSMSEYQMLVQLINDKLLKPYDDDALNFAGFVQFFWQSAIFCHNQHRFKAPHETGGKDISMLLYGEMITNAVTWFKFAARAHGQSTAIYDHPELAEDPQKARLLQQLNERVKDNPNLLLPPGFVMSKELHQERDYSIPESARKVLGSTKSMALELLDEIAVKSLGLRLLEPQIKVKETHVVKIATQHKKGNDSSLGASGASSTLISNRQGIEQSELSHHSSALNFRDSPAQFNSLSSKKNLRSQPYRQVKDLRANVQSLLQNRDFDDAADSYGLGSELGYRSEQAPSRTSLASLEIYKTENILSIVAENRRKETQLEAELLKKHRAGSSLLPVKDYQTLKTRANSQARSVQALPTQLKVDRQRRLQENLLFQSEMSADLKAATYEYQLSMNDGMDMENTRQAALVLEDMLKVVSSEIESYPYQPKKVVQKPSHLQAPNSLNTPAYSDQQKRAISLQMKNRNVHVKQRLKPGERISALTKQRDEDKIKAEEEEKLEKERKDMERIKRSIILKKRIADSHSISRDQNGANMSQIRANSDKGGYKINSHQAEAFLNDDISQALAKIKVDNPTELDKKKLAQLRAQQLKISEAERETRKIKMEEDGQILNQKDKHDKKQAARDARIKIQEGLERRKEAEEESKARVEEKRKAAEEAKVRRAEIEKSVERLARAPPKPKPVTPKQKPVDPKTKSEFKAKQKKTVDRQQRQKLDVYTKKERQEVLAFYLRPDVQTVFGEYERHFGILYDYIVRANDPSERDTKRMTKDGFIKGFGEAADLVPNVLKPFDLELLFDTIVNERVDAGTDLHSDPALTHMGSSISFEEFKKALIRIASIVVVTANKRRLDPNENEDIQARLLDNPGSDAPQEWDEYGNAIRYKTVIMLKRKDVKLPANSAAQSRPVSGARGASAMRGGRGARGKQEEAPAEPKLYDISKLKLEKFHHVLHFCYTHCKDKVVSYQQPEISLLDMANSQNAAYGNGGRKNRQNQNVNRNTDLGIQISPLVEDQSQEGRRRPGRGSSQVDLVDGRSLDVRADLVDSEEEKLSPQQLPKKVSAMEVTLGKELNNSNASRRNDNRSGALAVADAYKNGSNGQGSDRQNFRSSIGSQQRVGSDGQFSEYNDILRSPDKNQLSSQIREREEEDDIQDNYDLERDDEDDDEEDHLQER